MVGDLILPFKIIVELSQSSASGITTQTDSNILARVFKIAKEGKLLSLFCNYVEHFPRHFMVYLKKRCLLTKLYQDYLKIVSEELNFEGIEYYVFKTVKPFAYDMTDIDILIPNKKELIKATNMLMRKYGFRVIKKGTYSISLRKVIGGFDVDLDLQMRVATGTFEYIVISDLKQMEGIGCVSNRLHLLRPEIELLIVVGHTFYKDFEISLANILYARYLLKRVNKHYLSKVLSEYRYLLRPFKLTNFIVNTFHYILNAGTISKRQSSQEEIVYYIMERIIYNSIKELRGNIRIPLILAAKLYGEVIKVLAENHRYTQLREIVSLPRSRGTGILFRRIGLLPPEETIKV